jgi:protein prenyltransferase alpha subunit repeat containing protein 1
MSRALDAKVVAALKQADHRPAFNAISLLLTTHADPELLELEILGRGQPVGEGQFYLRDGNEVGVPKLVLLQAFIVAREILQKHLLQCPGRTPEGDEVLAATAVLLFMDAEHLTAANTRKRILVTRQAAISRDDDAGALLDRERVFVDSLLTSRLHRHTKSPTLWSHRRWLLQRYGAAGLAVDGRRDLRIVMTSGERHPRNYYAWCHARFVAELTMPAMSPEERRLVWDDIKKWCFLHHDDICGWSFLCHLATRDLAGADDALSAVVRETLGFAQALTWRNESVWWFLRTAGALLPASTEDEARFQEVHRHLLDSADEASADRLVLGKAWQWYESHRGTVVAGGSPS